MPNSNVVIDLVAKDQRFKGVMTRVQRILKKTGERMQKVAANAKRMLLVGTGAIAGFIKLATVQENAVKGLEAALESAGVSTEVWSKQLQAAASDMQKNTTVGDEASLVYMTMALNLGITADKLVDATKGGLGLAKALGQDAKAGIRNFALALGGNFQMLSRYIPAIRTAKDDTAKLALVNEFAARGYQQLQAETETTAGKLKQLMNSLGDLGEEMGAIFLPTLDRMVLKIQEFVPLMGKWIQKNGAMILSLVKWTAALGVVVILLPKLVAAVGALITVLGALKISMAFFSPMTTALIALGAAVVALGGFLAITAEQAEDLGDALQKRNADFTELGRLERSLNRTSNDDLETQAKLLSRIVAIRNQIKETLDPKVTQITAEFNLTLKKQQELLAVINGSLGARADATRMVTTAERKLNDQIDAVVAGLRLQVDMYGLSTAATLREKLARDGANAEQLETIRLLQEQHAAQKAATEEQDKQTAIMEKAKDKIAELRKEVLLLSGAATEDQLELIDLRNLGFAKEDMREIAMLMEARRRATKAQQDIEAGTVGGSGSTQASIAGRVESLKALFGRIQQAAGSVTEKLLEKNAEDNRKSAAANQQSAGLLSTIAPLVDRIAKKVEASGTSGAVFG